MQVDQLTDILLPQNYHNSSGVYKVEYVFTEWIDTISQNGNSVTITIKSGESWITLESIKLPSSFSVKQKKDDNGDFYNALIKGHLPLKEAADIDMLSLISTLPIVSKVEDLDGNIRIIGSVDEPAELSLPTFNTQGLPGSREGISWEIKCLSRSNPAFA